jgi:glycyl-tRNA synthetase beta chain
VKKTAKGEYVSVTVKEEGRAAAAILGDELPRWITGLRFPKSMHWGEGDLRFARPIHWIVALLDGEVLDFEVEGIRASNRSAGHRFLSPASMEIENWDDYLRKMEEASVIVVPGERKGRIAAQIAEAAAAEGGSVSTDEELLDTVTHLVEYPVAVCGSFEEDFLSLPEEVLVTSMKYHQKYFTVRGADGELMARFIAVSNMRCADMGLIREGNERVLRARLSDARFFFEEDRKTAFADFVGRLDKVVYQEKLGTYREKIDRVAVIARSLAKKTGVAEPDDAARAALLSKADLVTQMVGEFPELQGVMGREYAIASGEKEGVAAAIFEHYRPRFASDDLPESDLGSLLSVADRVDSISGIFGIDEAPTGSEDPYGLRRHTLATINILTARDYNLDLSSLIEEAIGLVAEKVVRPSDELLREIMEFFRGRLEHLYVGAGFPSDVVRAVLAAGIDRLPEVKKKIEALESFRKLDSFLPVATTFKRASNIVPADFEGAVDAALLQEEEEKDLHGALAGLREKTVTALEVGDYAGALEEMAGIQPVLDQFFDKVHVMADDSSLRDNRLALVQELAGLFSRVADFRQISV